MASIEIGGMDKAEVLTKLYNNAKAQGLGFLQAEPWDMTIKEAQNIIDSGDMYFDYLKGRVMKVDLSGDILNTSLYDRDNGSDAALDALTRR